MKTVHLILLAITLFSSCASNADQFVRYRRKDWKHWVDSNHNCINTRNEILKERSEILVGMNKKGCSVKTGRWRDYYYPETHFFSKDVDMDHLIPLKHAHDIGGYRWSQKLKMQFANDPENLVITNKKYNRQKGAKRVDQWLPLNKTYACKYYFDWMKLKKKYNLPIQESEIKAVDLSICP